MCRMISIIVLLYAVIVYVLFSSTSIVCPLDKDVTRQVFATSRPVKFRVRYIFSYCDGRFRETIYPSPGFTDEMRDEWIRSHPTQIFYHTIWGWYSDINNNRFAISSMVMIPITILFFTAILKIDPGKKLYPRYR
jgi:hypothetical protein